MAGRFSVETVFKAIDRVSAPVKRMQSAVGKFASRSERRVRKLNKAMKATGDVMKRAARNALLAGGLFAAASGNVVSAGADFEQAIVDVGAVSLQTREQIAPLEDLALSLGRSTKFTATQAANAMEIMARAGFKTNEIIAATPAVLNAAAASGLEIAEVADHVSNVLKGMGLDTSEAARVADVLALASARTNSSIGSLGESMKNVASTARSLNVPLEDVVAGVALLQDVGLDASVAGSAFNVMLTRMATPSAKIEKVMRRLGLSFKDANGNMKPLPDVLSEINKATSAMGGNFDKVAFLSELVGDRGQKAASNLGDLFKLGKTQTLSKELRDAEGIAEKMAGLRMDTLRGSMTLLGSAVDAVKVRLFGMNRGPLKESVDRMTAWVGANEELIATKINEYLAYVIDNFASIVTWMKRIAVGAVAFVLLTTALKALSAVLGVINLLVAANPIVLMILGVLALTAAVVAAVYWWDEIAESFMASGAAMDRLVMNISKLYGPIGWLVGAAALITKHWEPIAKMFSDMWDNVGNSLGAGVMPAYGAQSQGTRAQMVSPQERTARSIEEQRTTSTAEVTIKDDTGRAEVTGGALKERIQLTQTGGF